jgi:hypothetical protein
MAREEVVRVLVFLGQLLEQGGLLWCCLRGTVLLCVGREGWMERGKGEGGWYGMV